jgi:hypothetical protein
VTGPPPVRGCWRAFDEGGDLLGIVLVHFDHAELVGHVEGLPHCGDRCLGPAVHVLGHHLCEVHAVDVVGADHYNDVRVGVVDEVQRLVDGVGAAQEPALAHALLGRNRSHVIAELGGHAPRLGDVAVKAVRLVLGEHNDLQVAGIHQVGQGEVDQAVTSRKRHGGFRAVCRQWHQPVSLAAREDNGKDSFVQRHNGRSCTPS